MVTLTTGRLILRPFREADLDAYAAMCADLELMRFIGEGKTLARWEAWRHIATMLGHWHLRGFGMWAVEHRETGAFVGRIGLWQPEGWPGFELGWMLAKSFHKQGFATEGARAALTYAFQELGKEHVISLIHPQNAPSIRVAERLGERLEGESVLFGTRVLVYGISR